jgi:biopolymer transport protein ExbD
MKKPDKPIYITIKADLVVAVGDTPVRRGDLVWSLENVPEGREQRIFLRADRGVRYGELMDVLKVGGYSKIALVALEGVPEATPSATDQSRP